MATRGSALSKQQQQQQQQQQSVGTRPLTVLRGPLTPTNTGNADAMSLAPSKQGSTASTVPASHEALIQDLSGKLSFAWEHRLSTMP